MLRAIISHRLPKRKSYFIFYEILFHAFHNINHSQSSLFRYLYDMLNAHEREWLPLIVFVGYVTHVVDARETKLK